MNEQTNQPGEDGRPCSGRSRQRKVVVGLLGGLGAGKTTVGTLLGDLGAEVISADRIVHRFLEDPGVRRQIARVLRCRLPADGSRLRAYLAERIFSSEEDRRAVEAVLHPLVDDVLRKRLAGTKARVVVLDVPLLLEAGMDQYCDLLIFVDAPEQVRRERVAAARSWPHEQFDARQKAQLSVEEKKQHCDVVIDNSRTLEETREQVERLWRKLMRMVRGGHEE